MKALGYPARAKLIVFGTIPRKNVRHSLSVIRGDVSRKVYCPRIPRQPQTAERRTA